MSTGLASPQARSIARTSTAALLGQPLHWRGSGTSEVAVDGTHIYWANVGTNSVGRADLDGTDVNQNFITGAFSPSSIAVDGGHVYWVNSGSASIGRADLDGSNVDQLFISGLSTPAAVATDGRHIYWADLGTDSIGRADLDGANVDTSFVTGAVDPGAVAVDDHYVYWGSESGKTVGRARLDGTGVNQSFIDASTGVFGLAVDAGPSGAASASAPTMSFATQPLFTLGGEQELTVTNSGAGVLQLRRAHVVGPNHGDFLLSGDDCSDLALWPGEACTIGLRFGPQAGGVRSATLEVASDDPASPLGVPLSGTAGSLPAGPAGAAGPAGPAGARGPAGRVRLVTCRKVTVKVRRHHKVRRVKRNRCSTRLVSGTVNFRTAARASARLSRHGRVYASGALVHGTLLLHARRRIRPAHYRLTLAYRHGRRRSVRHAVVYIR